jgi:hypothetical protein
VLVFQGQESAFRVRALVSPVLASVFQGQELAFPVQALVCPVLASSVWA